MANYDTFLKVVNNPNVLMQSFQDVIATRATLPWWLLGKQVDTGGGLKPKGKKFTRELDGGSRFEVPLMLDTNPNLKAFSRGATFNLTLNNIGDRAYYDIKWMGGPIPVDRTDIDASASGKTNLLNASKSFLKQANVGIVNLVTSQMFATAGSEGADDWNSLLTLIALDPTADAIGGISAAAYSKWRNIYKDATGSSLATYLKSYLTTYRVKATVGQQRPKLALMDETTYGVLDSQMVSIQQLVRADGSPAPDVDEAGFTGLRYGGMTVMFESSLSAGTIIGINDEGIEYGILKGCNMQVDPIVLIPGTNTLSGFVRQAGNLLLSDRRTHFHIANFSTV